MKRIKRKTQMKNKFLKGLVASFALAVSGTASAGIIYTDAGLSGLFETENFNTNSGHNSEALTQFSGITFDSGLFINSVHYDGLTVNHESSVLTNFWNVSLPTYNDIMFTFGFDVDEVAFAFFSNFQTFTFSTFLNGIGVETATISTGSESKFVKFELQTFDSIKIHGNSEESDAYAIDSLQFKRASVDVPEPSTFAVFVLGLMGLASRKFKKQA